MDSLEEQVVGVFETIFGRDITPEDTRDTLEDWTSLRHLQIVLALEEECDVELEPEEVQNLQSVQDFVSHLTPLVQS